MKEITYFRSAPFFLLKGLESDQSPRFGLFSNRTLLKPSLQRKEGRQEAFNDVVSLDETHFLTRKIADALQDAATLLMGLSAVFRKKLVSINEEESLLSHVLSHYPKREFDLKKIMETLPSLGFEEIPNTLMVQASIGALSQKGIDEGEFFIQLNNISKNFDFNLLTALDLSKKEIVKNFFQINTDRSSVDPSLFFKSSFFKGRYVPRLRYNRVILSAARWFFDASVIDIENVEDSIGEVLESFELDDVCFVEEGAKYVYWREEIPYLAHLFRQNKALHFVERLFTEKTVLIKGENTSYPSLLIVPLLKEEIALQEEITRLHA